MRILVLCDDRWHPASTPRRGLAPLAGEFTFDFIENAEAWSAGRMADYPLVILTKSDDTTATDHRPWMTGEAQQAFHDYVHAGNGLLVIHSGSASYADKPVLRGLLGGVFTHHPPQCPVTIVPQPGHPLTAGSETFTIKDEHYFMDLDDPQADVFLTTTSEHGTQPGGWTRREGAGRVCMLTPGHNVEVWLHPSYQTLMRNALRWCGKSVLSTSGA
jgi:type 1 glutamine amidotransferase